MRAKRGKTPTHEINTDDKRNDNMMELLVFRRLGLCPLMMSGRWKNLKYIKQNQCRFNLVMWSSSVPDRTRGTRPFMLIIISETDKGLDGGMTFLFWTSSSSTQSLFNLNPYLISGTEIKPDLNVSSHHAAVQKCVSPAL